MDYIASVATAVTLLKKQRWSPIGAFWAKNSFLTEIKGETLDG